MLRYILHRVGQTLVVVLGVTVIIFFVLRVMPGDPVQLMFGEGDDANLGESRLRYEQQLGLDQPLPVQYVRFLGEIGRGEFGNSIVRGGEPVIEMVARALPITVELSLFALFIALAIAIPVAILSALKQNTLWDRGGTAFALIGVSMPSFWQGLMLIVFLAVWVPIFPVSGVMDPRMSIVRITGMPLTDALLSGNWEAAWSVFRHMVLPALTLGTGISGQFVRVLRSSLLEVKHQDFIDAFRARGLGEPTIVRHMLHNALPTTAVIVGMRVGALLSGTIVIETVFAYPGMGLLLITAINARDFPVVQGVVVLLTVLVILSNLAADIIHGVLDPRIKLSGGRGASA
ncbi:MAG: ABC transporter permease [Rhodobacteraceae bacterium]|nr:ABC transporter permease [Paracoccaceae bacterium]